MYEYALITRRLSASTVLFVSVTTSSFEAKRSFLFCSLHLLGSRGYGNEYNLTATEKFCLVR